MRTGLKYFSVTLAATGSVGAIVPVPAAFGNRVIVKESSGIFYVKADDTEEIPMEVGLKRIVLFEAEMKQLTLINKAATSVTVEIYYGWDDIVDARLNTFIARQVIVSARPATTSSIGTGVVSLAAGASYSSATLFPGTLKDIVLVNLSSTSGENLYVKNVSGVVIAVVPPGTSFTHEYIGEVVSVSNPNAGAVSYSFGATYFA